MTTAVMGHDGPDVTRVDGPIVLALNCPQSQQYLVQKNEVLQRLIYPPLVRTDIVWSSEDDVVQYLNPIRHTSTTDLQRFADCHEGMSWKDIKDRSQDPRWLADQFKEFVLGVLYERLEGINLEHRVQLVFVDQEVVRRSDTLRLALEPTFPIAWFFSIDRQQHSLPTRIWNKPVCDNCSTEMREAGSAWACEGCGSVKKMDGFLCPECKHPMEELVLDGDPRRKFWCRNCGNEETS